MVATQPPSVQPRSPPFTFSLKVLTFDRLPSLRRCLTSLATADYGGDQVELDVFVDVPEVKDADATNGSVSMPTRTDAIDKSDLLVDFVADFPWPHGPKRVHYRVANAGTGRQWLEAWWPLSTNDYAMFIEDDMEVAHEYYRFAKALIMRYQHGVTPRDPSIFGISLQRNRNILVQGQFMRKFVDVDAEKDPVFAYAPLGTWGSSEIV